MPSTKELMSKHIDDLGKQYIKDNGIDEKNIAIIQEFSTIETKAMVTDDSNGMKLLRIGGYLSTFKNADRSKDIVDGEAFTDTLKDIKKRGNKMPMLKDHTAMVDCQMGAWDKFSVDEKGLLVEGFIIVDEKSEHLVNLILSGALDTLSMGGLFVYDQTQDKDGFYHIMKVMLLEGSIVSIPCNPKAVFTMKIFVSENPEQVEESNVKEVSVEEKADELLKYLIEKG